MGLSRDSIGALMIRSPLVLIVGVGTLCAAVLTAVQPADAEVFDWSFSGAGFAGSGTMDTTLFSPGVYQIDSITGTVNGATIKDLSTYKFGDQLVYDPPGDLGVIDNSGVSFSIGDGSTSYNIYANFDNDFYCGSAAPYCILGPGLTDGSNSRRPAASVA